MSPQKLRFRVVAALAAVAAVVALNASAQSVTVVEYYNKTLDAHFITGRTNEQTALDGVADFQRTGMTFQATTVVSAAAGLTKICRFYISSISPYVSSHFYGRQGIDCESIRAQNLTGFSWEDYDFATQQPVAGVCAGGTVTIFRGFRAAANGKTSNHRYSASQTTYDAAVAAGYVGEGAAFCVSAATAATPASAAVATAIGTTIGTPVSASIGPAGGTLVSTDGKLTLTVPANALSGPVALTIQPITSQVPGAVGNGYRLLPDGQIFAVPVQLGFQYDDQDVAGTVPEALGVAYQDGQRFWRVLKSIQLDRTNRKLTISTTHFTDWSKLLGFQLIPASARVAVGRSQSLALNFCETVDLGDELTALMKQCSAESGAVTVSAWAVNGVPGGNATVGTVAASGRYGATYNAPANKPSPNLVAVSATLGRGSDKYQVVSSITIVEDSWSGRTVATTEFFRLTADVKWTLLRTNGNISTYQPSGTASVVDFHCPATPASAPISASDGILMVDNSTNPSTWSGAGATVWTAAHACPAPEVSYSDQVLALFFGSEVGTVTAAGTTIEGTRVEGPLTIVWKLTRSQ